MPSSGHSAMTNERDLKVRSHQPMEGRARKCGQQGSLSDGRLGPQMGGFQRANFND